MLGGGLVSNLPRPPQVIISKNRIQAPLGGPFWTIVNEYKMTERGDYAEETHKVALLQNKL